MILRALPLTRPCLQQKSDGESSGIGRLRSSAWIAEAREVWARRRAKTRSATPFDCSPPQALDQGAGATDAPQEATPHISFPPRARVTAGDCDSVKNAPRQSNPHRHKPHARVAAQLRGVCVVCSQGAYLWGLADKQSLGRLTQKDMLIFLRVEAQDGVLKKV